MCRVLDAKQSGSLCGVVGTSRAPHVNSSVQHQEETLTNDLRMHIRMSKPVSAHTKIPSTELEKLADSNVVHPEIKDALCAKEFTRIRTKKLKDIQSGSGRRCVGFTKQ